MDRSPAFSENAAMPALCIKLLRLRPTQLSSHFSAKSSEKTGVQILVWNHATFFTYAHLHI
jgi:hypothetical protein